MRYSAFSLLVNALNGQRGWTPMWREPAAKPAYDVVIVGGGGHGLATAYSPCQGARHRECRGGGKGLARQRQCRAQHHDHTVQLPAAGKHPVLRMVDEAVGRIGTGHQLQRHGQPAWRTQPLSFRRRSATRLRAAATPCGCMASTPNCWIRRRCAAWCRCSISTTRVSRSKAACCRGAAARCGTTRSPGVMRARRTNAASISCRTAR